MIAGLLVRILRHAAGFGRFLGSRHRLWELGKPIYICLTVDLDAHGRRNAFEWGIPQLLRLYDCRGLAGKVTWFVNCREPMVRRSPDLPVHLCEMGYEVGLHCHLESFDADSEALVGREIAADKEWLEDVLGKRTQGFRSGRLLHTPAILNAVDKSGFRFDSSSTYGRRYRVGRWFMDDGKQQGGRSVLNLSETCLEFPVWEPFPDFNRMKPDRVPYFITTLVHPYNFVLLGRPNPFVLAYYTEIIRLFRSLPDARFVTLSQAAEIWNSWNDSPHS